jgi:hypothetical protein
MKIRHLSIRRFRGIKEFDWTAPAKTSCLVGPGDSSKSTILTAIEFTLLPHSNLRLTDADFFGCDPAEGFIIDVTVGAVPDELLVENRFGHHIRGINGKNEIHDEPEDGDEEVLTIRLQADFSLEPQWMVVNDRNGDGIPIGHYYRSKLGMVRLGQEIDRDLSWTRYSALTKYTEEGMTGVSKHLSEAHRQAREAVRNADLSGLNQTAKNLQRAAQAIGVNPHSGFHALLEPGASQAGAGALSLHDGEIPLRSAGLGTRRLVALALQAESVRQGAIVLIDEIETGMDPHRLRHLIRVLGGTNSKVTHTPSLGDLVGNCFFTTHSPVALRELGTKGLIIVRSREGKVVPKAVPTNLDPLIRTQPEAILARRVLVCEGATEVGLCRALDAHRVTQKSTTPMTVAGTFLLKARGGSTAEKFAMQLSSLGFETGLLGDSDVEGVPDTDALKSAEVRVFIWEGNVALEERIALDLPPCGLGEFLNLAVEEHGAASIADSISKKLGSEVSVAVLQEWISSGLPDSSEPTRRAIGRAAKGKNKESKMNKDRGWFKQGDTAFELGTLVAGHLHEIPNSPLARLITQLTPWVACE